MWKWEWDLYIEEMNTKWRGWEKVKKKKKLKIVCESENETPFLYRKGIKNILWEFTLLF